MNRDLMPNQELSLSDMRKIQVEILDAVDAHCRTHNITYSLFFGTLLGAVRHGGYIPWDDDIDLMMPRPDYRRFLETFNQSHDRFRVRSSELDPDFPHNIAKVECQNTLLVEFLSVPFEIGINIDVFPLDGVPADPKTFDKFFKNIKFYRDALIVKMVKLDFTRRSVFRNLLLGSLKLAASVFPYRMLVRKIDQKATQLEYETAEFAMVSCIHDNKRRHKAPKTIFEEFEDLEFEGKPYRAIKQYDEFLSRQYGNYMELPPEDQRVTHHNFKPYVR